MHGEDCAAINDHDTHGLADALNALDDVKVHPASQPTAHKAHGRTLIHDVIEPPTRSGRDDEFDFSYEP